MSHSEHLNYFAYGSNMDLTQMAERCPGAVLLGQGVLAGYRFGINPRGYATVVADATEQVLGLVWSITEAHRQTLDHFESVPDHYLPQQVAVGCADGVVRHMLIYTAVNASPGVPQPGYLEKILAAARHQGFPSAYLERLSRWLR